MCQLNLNFLRIVGRNRLNRYGAGIHKHRGFLKFLPCCFLPQFFKLPWPGKFNPLVFFLLRRLKLFLLVMTPLFRFELFHVRFHYGRPLCRKDSYFFPLCLKRKCLLSPCLSNLFLRNFVNFLCPLIVQFASVGYLCFYNHQLRPFFLLRQSLFCQSVR